MYKGEIPCLVLLLQQTTIKNIVGEREMAQNEQLSPIPSMFNPFPHINAFGRLCSRRLFENIVTKEEIAQNVQFLFLPQCFPLLVIGYPFNYRDFLCFDKIGSKSSAAELLYEGKG